MGSSYRTYLLSPYCFVPGPTSQTTHSHADMEAEQRGRYMGDGEARKERASEAEAWRTHLHSKNIMGIQKDAARYSEAPCKSIPALQGDPEGSQVPGQPWLSS